MKVDLAGQSVLVCGSGVVIDAVAAAMGRNGGLVERAASPCADPAPDVLVHGTGLSLHAGGMAETEAFAALGRAMHARGAGRLILLVSALAAVPARRFPEASIAAGAAMLAVRTLAMQLGPSVLVNAVGCGAIAQDSGDLVAGDASMLSHVPSGAAGLIEDVVNATLFLADPMNSYMTGQLLIVDGGWSAGYGRNF